VSTETSYEFTYTCSSTCGDVCYADVTTFRTDISEITSTQEETITAWSRYNGSTPTCTVPGPACTSLWDIWTASQQFYMSWYNRDGPDSEEPPWPYATPACSLCRSTGCYIQGGGKLNLYYWPVPKNVSRDMCTDFPSKGYYDPWQSGKYTNTSRSSGVRNLESIADFTRLYTYHDWAICSCGRAHHVLRQCVPVDSKRLRYRQLSLHARECL
jgi:hypothetical protein